MVPPPLAADRTPVLPCLPCQEGLKSSETVGRRKSLLLQVPSCESCSQNCVRKVTNTQGMGGTSPSSQTSSLHTGPVRRPKVLRKMAIRPCGHRLPNIVSVVCKKRKQISTQGSARVKTGGGDWSYHVTRQLLETRDSRRGF